MADTFTMAMFEVHKKNMTNPTYWRHSARQLRAAGNVCYRANRQAWDSPRFLANELTPEEQDAARISEIPFYLYALHLECLIKGVLVGKDSSCLNKNWFYSGHKLQNLFDRADIDTERRKGNASTSRGFHPLERPLPLPKPNAVIDRKAEYVPGITAVGPHFTAAISALAQKLEDIINTFPKQPSITDISGIIAELEAST